jgi:putative peptidoglycan lipid II flippase
MELPLGIFGVAIATVILPGLSRIHSGQDHAAFNKTLNWALRCIVLLGLPAIAGLFILATPLIFTLFQHGEFAVAAVQPTVYSLKAYCVGLLGFMMIKVLASAYFARQDTMTPVRYGVVAMAVNMALNLALIIPLAHVGLALATSLAACLNCTLLLIGLMRRGVLSFSAEWKAFLIKVLVALALMIIALWLLLPDSTLWQEWTILQRVMQLLLLVGVGGAVYFLVLFFSGMRVRDFLHAPEI